MATRNTQHLSISNKGLLAQLTLTGAAALAGSSAHAQIIYTAVNENIGFPSSDSHSFTTSLPGVNQFTLFNMATTVGVNPVDHVLEITGPYGGANLNQTIYNGAVVPTKSPYGQKWSSIVPGSASYPSAFIALVSTNGATQGYNTSFTDAYFDFKFKDSTNGNQVDYGYFELSITNNTYTGLAMDLIGYAYDASGAEIPAGAMPMTTPVPEPSPALALAALSALTLGAAGVRRIKALKAAV
jgi:hypothetical protein